MDLGNLKDSLLDLAKEKGKEAADGYLEEHEGEGIAGAGVGFGKDLLDKAFGGGEGDHQEEEAHHDEEDSSDNRDGSSDDDSGDGDGSEDDGDKDR